MAHTRQPSSQGYAPSQQSHDALADHSAEAFWKNYDAGKVK